MKFADAEELCDFPFVQRAVCAADGFVESDVPSTILTDPTVATVIEDHVAHAVQANGANRDRFPVRIVAQLKHGASILQKLRVSDVAVDE